MRPNDKVQAYESRHKLQKGDKGDDRKVVDDARLVRRPSMSRVCKGDEAQERVTQHNSRGTDATPSLTRQHTSHCTTQQNEREDCGQNSDFIE